jgi:hypothetical protein
VSEESAFEEEDDDGYFNPANDHKTTKIGNLGDNESV